MFHDAFFLDSEKARGSSIDRGLSHSGRRGENTPALSPARHEPWNRGPCLWEGTSSKSSSVAAGFPVLAGPSGDLDSTGLEDTPSFPAWGGI